MSSDEHLARAMRTTAEGLNPEIGKLLDGGLRHGRRLRRRRRIVQILGSTAAVAAIGTAGALVHPNHPAPPPTQAAAGLPTTPTPTPTGSGTASTPPVTGDDLMVTLKNVLPPSFSPSQFTGRTGAPGNANVALATAVVSDGEGPGWVNVTVGRESDTQLPTGATTTVNQNGSSLYISEFSEPYGDWTYGQTERIFRLVRTDGAYVELSEWNSATRKTVPVPDATAEAIVESPQWNAAAAAALAAPPPTRSASSSSTASSTFTGPPVTPTNTSS